MSGQAVLDVLGALAPVLVPVVFTALAAGTAALFGVLRAQVQKIKSQKLRDLVSTAEHFVEVVVNSVEANERAALVADTKDGKIPAGEGKKLAQIAVDQVKALLGTEGLADLENVLGVEGSAVGQYLSGLVEKHVANLDPALPPPAGPSAPSPK